MCADLLPTHLSTNEKKNYWLTLRSSAASTASVVEHKLERLLRFTQFSDYKSLVCVDDAAVDPDYESLDLSGRRFRVKYAGDTVRNGSYFQITEPLSSAHVAVERRALKLFMKGGRLEAWRVPPIAHWDKSLRLLVLGNPQSQEVEGLIINGTASVRRAGVRRAAVCLAALHCGAPSAAHLWGSIANDKAHWGRCQQQEALFDTN